MSKPQTLIAILVGFIAALVLYTTVDRYLEQSNAEIRRLELQLKQNPPAK